MPRKNRIVVTRPDLARVLAILDSHSKWPHRRIHHLDFAKRSSRRGLSLPRKFRLMSSRWIRTFASATAKRELPATTPSCAQLRRT